MVLKDLGHIHHTPPTAPQPGEICTHQRVNTHPKETTDDPSVKKQPPFSAAPFDNTEGVEETRVAPHCGESVRSQRDCAEPLLIIKHPF